MSNQLPKMHKTNKQKIQREKQKKEKPETNTVSLLITLASFNYLNLGNHSPEIPNLRQALL